MSVSDKPIVHIIRNNHFDPIWRRCWQRRLVNEGRRFASYADLQDWYMTDNLALARRDRKYKFDAECALVVRNYLKRHPDRAPELRRLARERRFAVTGGGDNIIDANMVLGETLVRNFVTGLLWVEENLGIRTQLAVRNDAFGNSAQVPQILRGCELRWVTGLSYSPAKGAYWRGLDGSVVCCAAIPQVGGAWAFNKYPPCPTCRGRGCRHCAKRGIDPSMTQPLPDKLDDAKFAGGIGQMRCTPEELLPGADILPWARRFSAKYDMRFALEEEAMPHLADRIAQVDDPPADQVHPGVELNPNNSGCLVTRIKLKQAARRQEYALLAAETLAALSSLTGRKPPRAALKRAWETLLFGMFHDAITATHVDPAYDELRDMQAGLDRQLVALCDRSMRAITRRDDRTVSVVNAMGHEASEVVTVRLKSRKGNVALIDAQGRAADIIGQSRTDDGQLRVSFIARQVAPLSAHTYRVGRAKAPAIRPLGSPAIENESYRVEAGEHGLMRIIDKRMNVEVARSGEYRPGEFILERDIGSPWATLYADRRRIALGRWTQLVSAEAGCGFQRLTFDFAARTRVLASLDPVFGRMTVTLYSGIARVDFSTRLTWDCYNERLRVAMPLARGGEGVYGIPYGMLQRPAYEPKFGETNWASANGDWPAVDWAGVESPQGSVALFSRGLPSYTVENSNVILLSLVRSPTLPTYLHEPTIGYSMTAYDGMRDAGEHHFDYALASYPCAFAASDVIAQAQSYNAGLVATAGKVSLPESPRVDSSCVRLAAMKLAEQSDAIVLRLAEYRGQGGPVTLRLPAWAGGAARVNLLERDEKPLDVADGQVSFSMRPWEIATVRLQTKAP